MKIYCIISKQRKIWEEASADSVTGGESDEILQDLALSMKESVQVWSKMQTIAKTFEL